MSLRRLLHLLRPLEAAGGVDRVHTHFGWRAAAPALYAGALLGAPTSITLHANDIYVPAADLDRKLRRFQQIVTVCQYNVDVIHALSDRLPPVLIVPCGVDLPAEEPAEVRGARLLSVGRIVPKKGFDDLAKAMELVVASNPNAHLDIIGEGPEEASLRALIETSPAREHIHLLGSRPNAAVLEAMTSCAAFVLACRREADGGGDALPVVLREAMARGRPVVSTDVAGIPETLEGAGWVVPSGDVTALAIAITAAINCDGEGQRRGGAARRRVRERYTLGHTAEGMWKVFDFPDVESE
jgi:glycosyltransferase involved in cell wall biosynthesis